MNLCGSGRNGPGRGKTDINADIAQGAQDANRDRDALAAR
jgi:hypothetical protein